MKALIPLLFVIFISLNACVKICDCFDECDRTVSITFDTSSTLGYKMDDIDTLEIVSLSDDALVATNTSIVVYTKNRGYWPNQCTGGLTYNINSKFSNSDDYVKNYNIILKNTDTILVRNIIVEGNMVGYKDCKCFTISKKILTIDSITHDLSSKPDESVIIKRK